MRIILLPVLLYAAVGCSFAVSVPLFDHLELGSVEALKYYMDQDRFERLSQVSLSKEKSMPSLYHVSKVALQERKRKNPNNLKNIRVYKIMIYPIEFRNKSLFFYEVIFANNDDLLSGSVYLAQDGKLVPSMLQSKWKEMQNNKKKLQNK